MGCKHSIFISAAFLLALLAGRSHAQQAPAETLRPRPATTIARPASAQGVIQRSPYTSNPFEEYGGYGAGDCANCCEEECWFWDPGMWVEADVLMWWRSAQNLPPLVTTSPAGTIANNSGVLPLATILYGNEEVGGRMRVGGRIDAGLWFDRCNLYGLGVRYTTLGTDTSVFSLNSTQNPIIARPFFDVTTDNGNIVGENAFLVAHPTGGPQGERTTGSITVTTTSQVASTDIYYRHNLRADELTRLDCIVGYQGSAINEGLTIDSTTTLVNSIRVTDTFLTKNQFNGGMIGLISNRDYGPWEVNLLTKVAFGTTEETVMIQGLRDPPAGNGNANTGLLAVTSNSGTFRQNDFCVSPEVALKLGYHVAPNMTFTVGYSVIYWSTVVRPGDQIDPVINPTQIDGALAGEARPNFRFNHDDFWVQGINLGLRWDY